MSLEEVVDRNERYHEEIRTKLMGTHFPTPLKEEVVKAVKNLFVKEARREGKFIVVSGVDKVGKETHCFNPRRLKGITSLSSHMNLRSHRVLKIRQPSYETLLGGLVSSYLGRKGSHFKIDGRISEDFAWILWSLDRAQHNRMVMDWIPKRKTTVIAKRWTESNVVYQKARGIDVKRVLRLERNIAKQDLTIVLDAPLEILMNRIIGGHDKDFYESKPMLEKVRKLYLNLPQLYPYGEVFIMNSSRSLKEVNADIISAADEFLAEK